MEGNKVVLLQIEDGIAIVTINRPKALNAINNEVMKSLDDLFSTKLLDKSITGVILTGSGEKSFVAGADITEFQGLSSAEGEKMSLYGQSVFKKIELFPKPVIALVNGFALGAGCEIAMSCHMRIATPNAKFGQPEVNLGLLPGYGGTQRLVQLIGKTKAVELLLTAEMINAEQAKELGLLNYIHTPEDAMNAACKIIQKIASKGPLAVSKVIQAVDDYFNESLDGYRQEARYFGETMVSEEAREGISAFIEKRKANFR
jgi:enoyl-CoA hydratase